MRRIFPVFVLITCLFSMLPELSAQTAARQDTSYGWQKEFVGGLNISQTSFDNWTQGGENSLAWQLTLDAQFANDQERTNWSNTGKFAIGETKVGDQDSRKSIDEIKLESVLSYKMDFHIDPYIAATLETQSTKGYLYDGDVRTEVSDFFDPAYLTQGVGLGYSPSDIFKTRVGFALQETITRNHPIPYADDPDTPEIEKTKTEAGLESASDFKKKINGTTLLTSKLELFSNLKAFNQIDVRWDSKLTAKISKYINFNLNVKIFYDRDISKKRQIKQALALGFSYTFF